MKKTNRNSSSSSNTKKSSNNSSNSKSMSKDKSKSKSKIKSKNKKLSLVLRDCKFCSRLRAPQFGFEGLLMHAASFQALLSHFETLLTVT